MPSAATRYAYVDALRAIAALLVVWTHVSESFLTLTRNGAWVADVAHELDLGRAGVVTFFAISGFVIPASLRGTFGEGARSFLIRRFFRLYPAYWVSVPLALVTSQWLWGKHPSAATVAANFTMIQEALGYVSLEGLYWTLQTELVFYALCLLLFRMGRLQDAATLRALIVGLAALFPAALALRWPVFAFVCLHLSLMCWGALWRRWQDGAVTGVLDRLLLWAVPGGWVVAALVFAVFDAARLRFPAAYMIGLWIFVLGTTAIRIEARAMAWMGEISYSLYLFHPVVFLTLLWWLPSQGWRWPGNVFLGAYVAAAGALSVAAAALVFYAVERPAMALGKRLSS